LPGGEDWQFAQADRLTLVDAQYVIETEDDARIKVRNQGVRHGPKEVMQRLAGGEHAEPTESYFRTTPRFYLSDEKYDWLRRSIFIASAERHADLVVVKVWRVL
jgi:hypothetical protein